MRAGTGILLSIAVAAWAAGCASPSTRIPQGDKMVGTPVWPPPPFPARVRFVRSVAGPTDLGMTPSLRQKIGELFAGSREAWFIRPTGVAATGRAIYVADPGAQALWVLDTRSGRFRQIREAGGQRLISPVAVAPGRNGRIYVADSFLGRIFVFGGGGDLRGAIADSRQRRPAGLAYDAERDRLYVADSAAHRVWVFAGDGTPVGEIGRRGTGDGEFNFPTHLAVDRDGTLYVTDSLNFRLQMFHPDGSFAGQFGRHGDSSGDLAGPKGVAVDSEGHIYLVETLFDTVQIFDRRGRFLLTFGERGIGPGQFWLPSGLFIDGRDRIYVADAYNQRIQIFEYVAGRGDE